MTSVLVTGGTSSPGLILLDILREAADRVHAVVRSEGAAATVGKRGGTPVYHDLAAGTGPPSGSADVLVHLAGVSHAAAADRLARAWGCRAAVCVSSASATVEGHPLAQRLQSWEEELFGSSVRWCVVRPTMIFGSPRDRNVRLLTRALHRLPGCPRFTGGGLIQPVFVDDVAAAVWEAARRTHDGDETLLRTIPYGGTRQMTFGGLCEDICEHQELRRLPVPIPVGMLGKLSRLTGSDRRGRFGHAVSMLTTTRVVASPLDVGLRHVPRPWPVALDIALSRYARPQTGGSSAAPKSALSGGECA